MKQYLMMGLLVVVATLSTGCAGKSVVPLLYPEQLSDTPWCRWDVTVAGFADARSEKRLGAMDEETSYTTASDVSEWVGRSVLRELKSRGCECSYVESAGLAGEGFVIGGEIRAVTLDKIGINQWSTRMDILVELTRGGELLFGQTYTGTVERTFLIGTEGPESILAEGLSDILSDATVKLTNAMREASR